MQYDKVNDSGERQEFETGAVRDTQKGKGRYDLISPIALDALAKHYENGAVKYGDSNWTKGIPLARFLDSALRHLIKYSAGDRSEDHIIACAWNCFSLKHTEELVMRGEMPPTLAQGLFDCTDADDELTERWWGTWKDRLNIYMDTEQLKQSTNSLTEASTCSGSAVMGDGFELSLAKEKIAQLSEKIECLEMTIQDLKDEARVEGEKDY